jgi:hypothetical protein
MQSLALLVGPLAGGAVTGMLGIRWDYGAIGVILLGAACVVAAFVREPGRASAR